MIIISKRFTFCLKQESNIKIYNVDKNWKIQKDIETKALRWTITDTSLSPDQRFLVSLLCGREPVNQTY